AARGCDHLGPQDSGGELVGWPPGGDLHLPRWEAVHGESGAHGLPVAGSGRAHLGAGADLRSRA
ncbi:unnamed protein product, partial [Effrenium voratum]